MRSRSGLLFAAFIATSVAAWTPAAALGPGSGTATITPSAPVPAGTSDTWSIQFTAEETMEAGRVRITIPAGWTAPQSTGSSSAGYVTVSTNEPSGVPVLSTGGQVVTIDIDTLSVGNTITLVYGDDAGGASARATAPTAITTYTFLTASDPSGTSPANIASSPQLTVIAGPPAYIEIAPSDTTTIAGTFAPYRLIVRDEFGNRAPVPSSRTVLLFPGHGSFYTTSNHTTPITQIPIGSGDTSVRIDYRGTQASAAGSPHTIVVFTQSGSPVLAGSDQVTIVPASLSTTQSTVSATTPVTANGTSQSSVTVTSKDGFGNLREGDEVELDVTGSALDVDPGPFTDENGEAVGVVTSTVAENVTVSATINGQAITDTAPIAFVAGAVSASTSLVNATTPIVANGSASSTITVTANDANGNPVQGQTVTLNVAPPGGGAVLTQPGFVTNASGVASGTLASTTTGPRTVTAVIGSTSVTDNAVVSFTAGSVANFVWSVDGAGVAGVFEQVTLTAKDAQGHTITDYTGAVNLSTNSTGVGNAVVEWSDVAAQGTIVNGTGDNATYTFDAGDNGVAVLRITDTKAETIILSASAGAASGNSSSIVVAPGAPDEVQLVAGDGQTATVNTTVATPPKVKVVDAFGNAVTGATVTFTVLAGGGTRDVVAGGGADATGVTASDGTLDCDVWRMGQDTNDNPNQLRAQIAAGSIPSVDFTATATAGPGADLVLTPGTKNVTVGSNEQVTATLTDSFGNPKSGEMVTVVIKTGLHGTLAEDPDPGTTTALNPQARQGLTDTNGKITVRYVAPGTAGLADVLDASTPNVAQSDVSDVTYTSDASGATNLRITFVGSSTQPAGGIAQFTIEAVDGNGNRDTGNTSTVTFTPEGGSGLVFSTEGDMTPAVTQTTLSAGVDQIWVRGTLAGAWTITASTGGGIGSDIVTLTVTDTGIIDHYSVSTVPTVVAGVSFNVSVSALDQYENLVDGASNNITLTAIDDVTTNPLTPNLVVTSASLAGGEATVGNSYTKADAIRVRVTAGGKEGISGILTVTPAAAKRITKVSGDGTGFAAGANRNLTVRVLDTYDNPVSSQSVSFLVLQGGGSVLPLTVSTGGTGDATTQLTTGAVAGDNRVRASILDGTPAIDEQVEFSVVTVAGTIDYFTVVPQKTSLVAGEVVPLVITAYDSGNNVVSGDNTTQVQLSSSGNAQFGAPTGTLTAGVFNTTVTDTLVQSFTVTAQKLGGGPPSGTSVSISVTNAGTYRVAKGSGDGSGITAGTTRVLQAIVRDEYFNVVPNALVTFSVASAPDGTGFFTDTSGDPDDGIAVANGSGVAQVTYHTAQTAGANQVHAQILDGAPVSRERVTFTVNTVAGGIDHYVVQMNATSTTAGVSKIVTVTAYDNNGNPVDIDGTQVALAADPGTGLSFGTNPLTLDNGVKTTTVTANLVQTYRVRASTVGIPSVTGLGPQVDVVPAAPSGTITATATQNTITANGTSTTTITSGVIRDAFTNQVAPGLTVNVSATNGGFVVGGTAKTIDVDGRISFDLRSSNTAGTSVVTMTSATGTATGTINITFAPKPAFAANNPPNPAIVVPGASVAFSVQVNNTTTTSVNLTTATTFTFTDGTRTYSANLSSPQTIPGSGNATLAFDAAPVNAAFTTASYAPNVNLIGTDQYLSPLNAVVSLPAASLLVTSIQMTGIVPEFGVVSRGQTFDVAVTVKNDGAQSTVIDDVDLVFVPVGLFNVGNAPELGQSVGPGASKVFNVPVTVQAGAEIRSYQIDAVATGTVGGQTVTDNAIAPFPLGNIEVTAAANLAYQSGTLNPTTVSRGDSYSFQVTIRNDGGGLVLINAAQSNITFTDGTRTYTANPTQSYGIPGGGATQTITFVSSTVPAAFTPGTYPATFNAGGTENGSPFSQPVALTSVLVQLPAAVTSAPGNALSPDQVTKTTTATFTVQLQNSGATVVLTPGTTTIRFSGSQYTAALNPTGPTTIGPGTTTLQFLGATVSAAIAPGNYFPTVQLNGTENGNAFSQSIVLTDGVLVQNAPSIAILDMRSSQPQFTQDQTKPIKVRMVVSNNNGANVTFTAASMRFIHAGVDRTSQFVISTPSTFQGGSLLTSGEVDTVVFNVSDNTGNPMSVGNMTIEGELEVEEVNTSEPVFADTDLGGKGNLQVMTPATITFDAVIPSQTVVTQGMTRDIKVRAVVRNAGGSDVVLALSNPSTHLNFLPSPGWVVTSPATLAGGNSTLTGGEIDTLIFNVTGIASTPGPATVSVTTLGTESNSGRSFPQTSTTANLLVETPGSIQVVSVVPSQSSITGNTTLPWTITVTLTNAGESDVDLDLGSSVGLTIQSQATPPSFTMPGALAGGGTLLSGGETDQLVIPLTTSGTYASNGSKNITVDVDGTEVNSGAPRNDTGTGSVLVQQAPDAAFVSLTPGTVSRLTNVAFAVTVSNPLATDRATMTLDRNLSRLRFGSNQYNVGLAPASPVDIASGAQATLQFTGAVVGAGVPLGVQSDAELELHWTHNGATGTEIIDLGSAITVQNAPSLSILSVRPSKTTLTRDQTNAGTVTMVVRNSGEANVDLDLSPAVTRLGFKKLSNGATVTGEYDVQAPTDFEAAGGTVLAGGATDSLVFGLTEAGTTTGTIIVDGYVGGIDLNSSLPVNDNTADGGSGSLELQLAGALSILAITPSQSTATTGQTGSYTVKMAVRNTGGAAINVSLPQASSDIQFAGKSGFIHSDAAMPNGVTLSGGETDTLRFTVTTTGSPAGLTTITGNVSGVETNTGSTRNDDTTSGGTGSILLQTPAVLVVDSVTPSQPSVTASSSAPWNTTIALHNSGQSDARLTLPAGFTISVQSSPGTTFASPVDLEEGGVILAGGASGTLVATAPSTGSFSTLGNRAINVTVGATEVNSNRPLSAPGTGSVLAQSQPDLVVTAVRPAVVTSLSVVDFEVDVQNAAATAATARLDRGATRVYFASQAFSAFLDVTSADSVEAGETVTLRFEAKIIPGSIAVGPYDFNVNLAYTHNGIARVEPEVRTNGVTVQAPPQLAIQQIVTSQPSVTAGQTVPWTATMTVVNNGAADIDLDLAAAKTRLTFIGPGGSQDTNYDVSAGVVGAGEDTLSTSETANIVFTITETGTQTGNIVISGRVEGRDLNQLSIVTDDTFDGGRGGVVVQGAPSVSVLATHTSQPQVTVGQTGWSVRVVVANTGGANVTIGAATVTVAGGGWTFGPPTLMGGGNVLAGGAVDSLLFTATGGPGNAGTRRIDATVPWTEDNTSNNGSANTNTSGFGSITVESRAILQITTTSVSAPNPASVNVNQAFNITVQIQNTGGADARNVVVGMTRNGASTIQPVAPLAVVPAGQTVAYDLPVVAAAAQNPSETFTTTLSSATDENSGQGPPMVTLNNPPADATATLAIETVAALDITNVRPSQATVTRGQPNPWNVIVRVRNTGQSDAVLAPPAAADIGFSLAGSTKIDYVVQPPAQFGSGAAGWTLPGLATDSLIYRIVTTGNDPGTVDIGVAVDGTDRNDPTRALNDTGAGTVVVQDLAGVFIASTVPVGTFNHVTVERDIVNTGFAYEIHVTVQNSGGEGVDSVLVNLSKDGLSTVQPTSLMRRSIAAGANHVFVYRITSASSPDALETFNAQILAGMKSANSGQPVNAQQSVDARHQVVIQRPADLSMNLFVASPPGSAGGVVGTNQLFTLGARVSNLPLNAPAPGVANVTGTAEVTLTFPPGFSVQESLTQAFAPDDTVRWTVTAPGAIQSAQNFTCVITTTPNDVNTAAPAFASKASDTQSITVSSGGALASPTITITSPAGAMDDTLSVGQNIEVTTSITVSRVKSLVGTLSVPAGFSVVGSTVHNFANAAGLRTFTYDQVIVANSPVASADLYVTFTALDTITGGPVPSAADTVRVAVVPRTSLSVAASVTSPPEAVDNTVAIGAQFTVTANVANAAGAADIAAPGSLQITLPPLYSLDPLHTPQKPFVVGTPVSWVVNAAAQPSGPDQIAVNIVNIPDDENSGLPAQVTTGTATIAMVTEGAAVSVRDVSSARSVGTGAAPAGATNLDVLAFEIAYNVTDITVSPAEVDTIALTILDKDGRNMSPGVVAQTLARLSVDLGGVSPYEVTGSQLNANPVRISLTGGGSDRRINPDGSIIATVFVDLDASPRATELRVRLRGGGLVVRDPGSGPLDVTDPLGQPLDEQITSGPLVVLSSNFEEYAHNAPNPFRAGAGETQISYFLDAPANVSIRIFDITGELVYEETIPSSDPRAQSGPQETPWDGRNMDGNVVRNGLYVCVLNAGSRSAKIRIAVAK